MHYKILPYLIRQLRVGSLLVTLTILASCVETGENFVKGQMPIEIYQSAFPDTGSVDQSIEIQLRARAENGCHSDLEVALIQVDSRHFLFKATSFYDSRGTCPNVIVYKDTTITFTPSSAGDYFFQVNEDPFEIKRDTITIN